MFSRSAGGHLLPPTDPGARDLREWRAWSASCRVSAAHLLATLRRRTVVVRGCGEDRTGWESHCAWGAGGGQLQSPRGEGAGQEASRGCAPGLASCSCSARTPRLPRGPAHSPPSRSWRRAACGSGWARSRRIPGRAAPPPSPPGGRRLPPAPPPLDHGRWWPQAPQAARTGLTALPSAPLPGGRPRFHRPDPVGWAHWALAGYAQHRRDTLGSSRTASFPPRQRGPRRRDATPRPPRAPPPAAAARRRPGAARRPGQCPPPPGRCWRRGRGLGATWGWAAFQGQAPDPPVLPLVTAQLLAPALGVSRGSGYGKVSLGYETVVSTGSPGAGPGTSWVRVPAPPLPISL